MKNKNTGTFCLIPYLAIIVLATACGNGGKPQPEQAPYTEQYRPQIHFTPKEKWMNDPNGMVYLNGTYHLFYQHFPDSTVWGPMHWGHATSTDLVHWQHQPIALYPDSLGYIFSGSCVVDSNNTSSFGKDGKAPLIAIFTHHDMKGEKAGTDTFQYQSIAYSFNEGKTWVKYANNPVLRNPGIRDFRDPKVMWYAAGKKWIMTLATKDRVTFYSSPNLKNWTKESEFGATVGAHGGVWECPDLFPLNYEGKTVWILLASINPGGPNGGSATQYFTGNFDGKTFTPFETDTRWIDYGTDNYAGVTFSNTGNRKIFIGWMSNWNYATIVPTQKWRSAMTIPRELGIKKVGGKFMLTSLPVQELNAVDAQGFTIENKDANNCNLSDEYDKLGGPSKLTITADTLKSFTITFSNTAGEKLIAGYEKSTNQYFIDRSQSGKTDFEKSFAGRHIAPRLSNSQRLETTIILDNASIEMFADSGLSVMTDIVFPSKNYTSIQLQSPEHLLIKNLLFNKLKSIWE